MSVILIVLLLIVAGAVALGFEPAVIVLVAMVALIVMLAIYAYK